LGYPPAPKLPEIALKFSRNKGDSSYEYLLGYPDCPNDPSPRYNESPEKWQLLLQTNGFTGGDILYFIDKIDLANRDFKNVWVDIIYD
jgi:uncharacterized protein YwqG